MTGTENIYHQEPQEAIFVILTIFGYSAYAVMYIDLRSKN